jgi:hypothetical protein
MEDFRVTVEVPAEFSDDHKTVDAGSCSQQGITTTACVLHRHDA